MKRRMNNFFKKDGKSFVLAMDHAAMMPSPDLKDPGHVIREAVAGGADGFLTTYGIIKTMRVSSSSTLSSCVRSTTKTFVRAMQRCSSMVSSPTRNTGQSC